MKMSKNTSLYKLIRMGGMGDLQTEKTNLCAVFWHALIGLGVSALLAFFGGVIGALIIVLPIISIVGYFQTGVWCPTDGVAMSLVLDVVAIAVCIFGYVAFLVDKKRNLDPDYFIKREEKRRQREANPGLLRTAYRSWKEKTCVLIKFEDAQKDVDVERTAW